MPPREIRELRIDLDRYAKLAAKGISPEEVREAVSNASRLRRGPRNQGGQVGQCYFIEGRTDAGRPLKVLVRRFSGGWAKVITAWEPRKGV